MNPSEFQAFRLRDFLGFRCIDQNFVLLLTTVYYHSFFLVCFFTLLICSKSYRDCESELLAYLIHILSKKFKNSVLY